MNKKIILIVVAFFLLTTVGFAAPTSRIERTILPETDSTYELGASGNEWLNIYTDQLCLAGSCKVAWPTGGGGSGGGTFSTTTAWGSILYNFPNNSTDVVAIGYDGSGVATSSDAEFVLDPTAKLGLFLNSTKVGIGTSSPNSSLVIKGVTGGDGVTVERFGSSQDSFYRFTNQNGVEKWRFHMDGSSPEDLFIYPDGADKDINLQINEAGTAFGNVGIGTTSPYAKLSVVGQVVGSYFTATTTTATSTFSGGVDVSGALKISTLDAGVVSLTASTTARTLYYRPTANTNEARGTALQSAFTASAAGDTIVVGPGEYKLSAELDILDRQTIILQGSKIIASTGGATDIFSAAGKSYWRIIGNGILQGNGLVAGTLANEAGVRTSGANSNGWLISGIYTTLFKGGGIIIQSTGTSHQGGAIENVYAYQNTYGIYTDAGSEYHTINGITLFDNTTGIYVGGGNVTVTNANISDNTTGVYVDNPGNSAHGTFSNCHINHNDTDGVYINQITLGMTFSGCHFFGNDIEINASRGVNIIGGMGSPTFTLTGSQTGYSYVKDFWFTSANPTITATAEERPYLRIEQSYTTTSATSTVSSGILPAHGGTGTTTVPSAGKLLIGQTDGTYKVASLTAGSNITITEGSGSIEISAASGGGGSGGGTFSTTTCLTVLCNYPNNVTDIVTIGSNATTSAEMFFDPNTNIAYFGGKIGINTASPTSGLTIQGTNAGIAATSINMAIKDSAGTGLLTVSDAGDLLMGATAVLSSGFRQINIRSITNEGSAIVLDTTDTDRNTAIFFAANSSAKWNMAVRNVAGGNSSLVFQETIGTSGDVLALVDGGNVGIGTTSPYAKLSVTGQTVAEYFTATSTTASSLPLLNVSTVLQIPNGTAPTADDPGEIAHDTTDNMFILDDFVVGKATNKIWSVTVASTSPAFISGGLLPVPVQLDGYTITAIRCYVVSGTSKVIAVEDASANSSEDITCATTTTSDDGSITNATYTAAELSNIDFGATSGAVDYVTISVFGTWTRE